MLKLYINLAGLVRVVAAASQTYDGAQPNTAQGNNMNVYITGIGHTQLGRHPDLSVKELTAMAVNLALKDSENAQDDIQAAWFSNVRQGQMENQNSIRGQCALNAMGFNGIPIFNIENACASSSSGLFNACMAIESGMFDTVLIAGTEKMFYPEKKQR